MAKAVAPTGRALFFQAAPSAAELEVEAERCITNVLADTPMRAETAHGVAGWPEMDSGKLAAAGGCNGMGWRRTEAVLDVALRPVAPTERAVRRADRANMVSWSWLAGCGERRGAVGLLAGGVVKSSSGKTSLPRTKIGNVDAKPHSSHITLEPVSLAVTSSTCSDHLCKTTVVGDIKACGLNLV